LSSAFTQVELLVVIAVMSAVTTFLMAALSRVSEMANQSKCANNLKQIALAAVEYSDDRRFFPHLGPINELDPGWESPVAAKCARTLAWCGYVEEPEVFVCPSSPDEPAPYSRCDGFDVKNLCWANGAPSDRRPLSLPLYQSTGQNGDKNLSLMTDLSYGWTRRGLWTNCTSCPLLVADKARLLTDTERGVFDAGAHAGNMRGNHPDCIQGATVGGFTVRFTPTTDIVNTSNLGATVQGAGGFMGVLDDSEDP
jgi:type II secretory pathway pseudopilin PulG